MLDFIACVVNITYYLNLQMQNNFMESMKVLKRLIEIDPKNNIAKRELTEVTTQQVRKVKCIPLQLTRENFV